MRRKPRVMVSGKKYRIVVGRYGYATAEQSEGLDATRRRRWTEVPYAQRMDMWPRLVNDVAEALLRRERLAREKRRRS